jgi:hypothetical protein
VPEPSASIVLVTRGIYDAKEVLAAFEDPDEAQRFADRWNLANLHSIRIDGDQAVVADTIGLYLAGAFDSAT